MTDDTQPEAREFTMSQYASKDDMIGAMRKRIAELESELEAIGAGGVSGPLIGRAALSANAGQAGEYPALVCDYCGALTPDPWHSSGMLRGKMSKHIHSCDACAARVAAQAQAAKQQEQLI